MKKHEIENAGGASVHDRGVTVPLGPAWSGQATAIGFVAGIGCWTQDIGTGDEDWSDEFYRLLGYSPGEIKPGFEAWIERVHIDDRHIAGEAYLIARHRRQPVQIDYRVQLPDGDVRWLSSRSGLSSPDPGTGPIFAGVHLDVTDRAAETLSAPPIDGSKSHLETAVDHHAILSIADIKGNITYVNDKFCDVSGFSRDELIGQNHSILKSGEHDAEFYRDLWRTIANGGVWQGIIKNRKKNGDGYWVRATIVPTLGADGKPVKYISIRTDISERKSVEEELDSQRSLFEAVFRDIPDLLVLKDIDHRIVRCNPALENVFGYELEEVIGKSSAELFRDVFEPGDGDGEPIDFGGEDATGPDEAVFRRKSGERFFGETFSTPIRRQSGELLGHLCIVRDITERKLAEEALIAARDAAHSANKVKSEFLAHMSHEIRTPMSGVMGLADILLGLDLSEEAKQRVFTIKDITRSLVRIINDILDMSKLEAGKMEVEMADFHLPALIEDSLAVFEEKRSGERHLGLKLQMRLSDGFPTGVQSDPTRVRQVLLNLIGNAVKFASEGSVTVEGSMISAGDDKRLIRIAVHDTGIGIAPEVVGKLFSEFTQADASISRRFEGTGLGLSICKRLVQLMGGEIGVESVVGEGSTFWFTLPFVPAVSEVRAEKGAAQAKAMHYRAAKPLNVLVAEDNLVNQQIIGSIMESFGHRTTIVENGLHAVAALQEGEFDIVLMDVRMPEMSGPDAASEIRRTGGDKRDIPIIALTADAMEENQRAYLKAGMNDCVTKPIDRPELALAMNKAMGFDVHLPVAQAAVEAAPVSEMPVGDEAQAAVDEFLNGLDIGP